MSTNLQRVIAEELKVMGGSLIRISEALLTEEATEVVKETPKKAETKVEEPKQEVKEEKKEEPIQGEMTPVYTEKELNDMKYNDIKKLAKELGVSATGAKATIVERILEVAGADENTEATTEEVTKEDEVVVENNQDQEDNDADDENEDISDAEMDEVTISDQVEAELKDYSVEEIADLLESVGISPKGKRQALIAKVVKAVEEGLIALTDEDEEEGQEAEPQAEEQTAPQKEVEKEADEDEENEGDFLLKCNTKVREKAVLDVMQEVADAVKNGDFSDKEIDEALADFYLPHEGFDKKMPKDEKVGMLKELYARMIDDEGTQHDFEEAYYINDEPVCCGHILNYDEDEKEFICSVCANKYGAE